MTSRAADIRDAVLIALALVLAAAVSADLPYVGLPLAGAALAWLAYRYGMWWSFAAAAVVSPLAVLAAPVQVLFVLPALLAAGPGAVLLLRRWSAQRTVAAVTLALIVATMLPYAAHAVATGNGVLTVVMADYRASVDLFMRGLAVGGGLQALGGDATVRRTLMLLLPTVLFYPALIAGALDVFAVTWAARRRGVAVHSFPPLGRFDVSPHWVWLAIAGLAFLAAALFTGQTSGWMELLGANALLIVRPIMFVQGFGVFAAIYDRAKVGRIARGVGYTLLVAMEFLFPSVSILGLADVFANFRKLDRAGMAPRGEKAQIGG